VARTAAFSKPSCRHATFAELPAGTEPAQSELHAPSLNAKRLPLGNAESVSWPSDAAQGIGAAAVASAPDDVETDVDGLFATSTATQMIGTMPVTNMTTL